MMVVDFQVALGFDRQREASVPGEKCQHVIEEADSCVDINCRGVIQRQLALDARFSGRARYGRAAFGERGFRHEGMYNVPTGRALKTAISVRNVFAFTE